MASFLTISIYFPLKLFSNQQHFPQEPLTLFYTFHIQNPPFRHQSHPANSKQLRFTLRFPVTFLRQLRAITLGAFMGWQTEEAAMP